jgi:carboxymethylenebutenolidase
MTNTSQHTLELTDGRSLQLTVAEPDGSVRAGVMVLGGASGVTPTVRVHLSWLADEGWLAVAPQFYRRSGVQAGALSGAEVLADTDATCKWLGQQGVADDMIGVVGFGLGGTVAMLVAANRAIGAAVSVAPPGLREPAVAELPALDALVDELACPWLGIFDERGTADSEDEVDAFQEAARASEVATEVVRLPGATRGFGDKPESRTQAWQRTVNWFDSNLR